MTGKVNQVKILIDFMVTEWFVRIGHKPARYI